MKPRVYTPLFKLRTCRRVAAGKETQAQICRDLGLCHSVLERWCRLYRAQGEDAFVKQPPTEEALLRQRVSELERFCGQLACENEVLKRAVKRCR